MQDKFGSSQVIIDYQSDWKFLGLLPEPVNPAELALEWENEVEGKRDGEGKRFWIPSLFLLAGQVKKALAYCKRYEKRHLDESMTSMPEYLLCYLLALMMSDRSKRVLDFDAAGGFLMRRLYGANPYMMLILLERQYKPKPHWHPSNVYGSHYAENIPHWIYDLWSAENKNRLVEAYDSEEFQYYIAADDRLWNLATILPVGMERSERLRRYYNFNNVMLGRRK